MQPFSLPCKYTHTNTHTYAHTHTHTHTFKHMHTLTRSHIVAHIHTHTRKHTHAHTHKHTHRQTHTDTHNNHIIHISEITTNDEKIAKRLHDEEFDDYIKNRSNTAKKNVTKKLGQEEITKFGHHVGFL